MRYLQYALISLTFAFPLEAIAAVKIIDITREYGFINVDVHSPNKPSLSDITCSVFVNDKLVQGGQKLSTGAFNRVIIRENSKTRGKPIEVSCE